MLSRSQFDDACKAYIDKHPDSWTWEDPFGSTQTRAGFGYMSRSTIQSRRIQPAQEQMTNDESDEAAGYPDSEVLICQQYVVYSATFQVPTFYFTMHDSQGTPLSLDALLSTTLFRRFAFSGVEKSGSALTLPTSSFPLLSQGDHQTLDIPCWYLHPCETAPAVEELLTEKGGGEWLVNVIELWMLIIGNVIEL